MDIPSSRYQWQASVLGIQRDQIQDGETTYGAGIQLNTNLFEIPPKSYLISPLFLPVRWG